MKKYNFLIALIAVLAIVGVSLVFAGSDLQGRIFNFKNLKTSQKIDPKILDGKRDYSKLSKVMNQDTQVITGQTPIMIGGETLIREKAENSPIFLYNAELSKLSASIVKENDTNYKKVNKIVLWIKQNFRHYLDDLPTPPYRGALSSLSIDDLFHWRTMGCHDFVYLLVSMLKSIDIIAYDYNLWGHGVAYIPSLDVFIHGDSPLTVGVIPTADSLILTKDEFTNLVKANLSDKNDQGYMGFTKPSNIDGNGEASSLEELYSPLSEAHIELVQDVTNSNNFDYYFTSYGTTNFNAFTFEEANILKEALSGILSNFNIDEIHIRDTGCSACSKHFFVITDQKPVQEFDDLMKTLD